MGRPLPSGRVFPNHALLFGIILGLLGEGVLLVAVHPITAVLGSITLLFYLGIYTPSKPMTPMSILIGAIPGALPPVMGWAGATGSLSGWALLLFAIVFIWQIPHFLAIAFMYQEDYRRANLPVLSISSLDGIGAKQTILYSLILIPLTLVPSVWGDTGTLYLLGALISGLLFLAWSVRLVKYQTLEDARNLFLASIVYLPVLAFLMVWDRIY